MKPTITQSYLKSILSYDENTGQFIWLNAPSRRTKKGSIAGGVKPHGYIIISINANKYLAHILAWIYVNGDYPKEQLDHINHNRADNRIANLREVTLTENARNRGKCARNTSGVLGVIWDKKNNRWHASIGVDAKTVFLGRYVEFSDAVNARKNAEVLYGYHQSHGKDLKCQ